MATILVTGGAGFIGSHTVDALIARGHTVRLLDLLDPQIHGEIRSFPGYLPPAAECIRGDVRDPGQLARALEGVDAVYHFAALTGVGQSMYEMASYVDTNCTGTASLLEAIVRRGRPYAKLILASSRAVYGEGSHQCPKHGRIYPPVRAKSAMERGDFSIVCPLCGARALPVATTEERPLTPISLYGWTKKQQEELCQYAASTYSIPIAILRYFNVYGSRQSLRNPYTGIVSIFYSRIQAGQPISVYEHGIPLRDFVHVSDVVRANVAALEAEVPPGACINIGTGQRHTITEVAKHLAAALGKPARLEDKGEFRVGDIHACFADLERAQDLLGYAPAVTLGSGLKEFVTWAKDQPAMDLYQRTVDELKRHGLFGQSCQNS